jgi:tetratricopeptide (TPR) repeat protein
MKAWAILKTVVEIIVTVGILGWLIWLSIRKAEDPARMIFRWVLTAGAIVFMYFEAFPLLRGEGYDVIFGFILVMVCGVSMIVVWRHSIGAVIAAPFGALYDGGNVPPEPRPAYSVGQARRKQGNFSEALAEVQKQLDVFPTDLEGHMLMAEIQARDLKDLLGAEQTLQNFVAQPNHAPANIAFVLYSMADWYLEAQDRDGARRCLEQIQQILPNSEFALGAANRIAHLANADAIVAARKGKNYTVKEGVQNLGLRHDHEDFRPTAQDPAQLAGEYVKHLQEHPLDTEAREKLAVIYCDHYGRLDLAADQLEQMISQPHQSQRMIVHWLNLLADFQVRSGGNYDTVRQTLERIIELGPNVASAQMARNRIDRLKLELKTQEKSEAKKLGSYEQNIGLKQGLPRGD